MFDRQMNAKVDVSHFRRLLGQLPQWQLFAGSFHWQSPEYLEAKPLHNQ